MRCRALRVSILCLVIVVVLHTAFVSLLFNIETSWSDRGRVSISIATLLPNEVRTQHFSIVSIKDSHEKGRDEKGDGQPTMATPEGPINKPNLQENRYYESRELTQKPLVKVDVPTELMLHLVDGMPKVAILSLFISEYGDVDHVAFNEEVSLPEQAKKKLERVFGEAKFHPGQLDDIPVRSLLRIVVRVDSPVLKLQSEKRGAE
jgi:hypothetical protein